MLPQETESIIRCKGNVATRKDSPNQIRDVVRLYGFKLLELEERPSAYLSIAAYRAMTNQGDVFVKPFPGTEIRLANLSRRLDRLKRGGFDQMPAWHSTASGRKWVRVNGKLYYLTEWIQGQPLGDNSEDLRRLGEALAKLHTTSSRFVAPKPTMDELQLLERRERRFLRHYARLTKGNIKDGAWYRDEGERCLNLSANAWRVLRRSDVQMALQHNRSFVHGDVTRPNVLVQGDRIWLLDWELLKDGSSLFELAKAMSNTTDFDINAMAAILSGYETSRRLSQAERLAVSGLFSFPREAWFCASRLLSGRKPRGYEVLRTFWERRLQAVSWLENWAHEP